MVKFAKQFVPPNYNHIYTLKTAFQNSWCLSADILLKGVSVYFVTTSKMKPE